MRQHTILRLTEREAESLTVFLQYHQAHGGLFNRACPVQLGVMAGVRRVNRKLHILRQRGRGE